MSPALAGGFFTTVLPGKPKGSLRREQIVQNMQGKRIPCRGKSIPRFSEGKSCGSFKGQEQSQCGYSRMSRRKRGKKG